jgi:ABC-type nitrate/sulfonate/bicarbonate transport system permease component
VTAEAVIRGDTGASRARVLLRPLRARLRAAGLALAGVGLVVGLWWIAALILDSPVRLPTPPAVAEAISEGFVSLPALQYTAFQSGGIWDGVRYTVESVVMAVAIGSAAGLAFGLLIGRSRIARDAFQIPLLALGTIPVLVILPFITQWFGTSRLAQAGIVIFAAFVTVATVVQQATLNVGARYQHYAQSLGASRRMELYRVTLPAIVPDSIGAVRVALAAGWGYAAISELLGADQGAGRIINAMANISNTASVIAVVVCLSAAAVVIDAIVAALGKWVTRWQE